MWTMWPIRGKRIKDNSFPWMSNECIKAINVRDELLKDFRDTKDRGIWLKYTRARNYVTNLVRGTKKQYFSDTIKESKDKPKLLWTHLKRLLPDKRPSLPVRVVHGGVTIDGPRNIANAFNDFFTSVVSKLLETQGPYTDYVPMAPRIPNGVTLTIPVPSALKDARVTPIFKSGDKENSLVLVNKHSEHMNQCSN